LKTLNVKQVQDQFPDFDIQQVQLNGRSDPNFMTIERYLKSRGSLGETRAFLWHTIGLSLLFTGNGYTSDDDNNCGTKEYLTLNQSMKDISYVSIPLPISVKDLPHDPIK